MKEASEKRSHDLSGIEKSDTSSAAPEKARRTGPSNNQRQAWTRELSQLEEAITRMEARQAEIQALLADTATYEDKARFLALAEEQRGIEKDLGAKMARWEELSLMLGES